jgi:histidinol phosphatase-like enzyme
VGLCNVNVTQIAAAREIAEIWSVQVSLSVLDDENVRNGVVEYCRDNGIHVLAYRPLGGQRAARLSRETVLVETAKRHQASPHEIALAWLMHLAPGIVPLPGATREETARSIGRSAAISLTDEDLALLDERFPARRLLTSRSARAPSLRADGDVVLVMGMPGAGKSSVAAELQAAGFERLNRDQRGGSLSDLTRDLEAGLSAGKKRWVLDNTYPTRKSRSEVIECAWRHGVPVRCVHVTTALADAQINAITRLLEVHGTLPTPEQIRETSNRDPRYFGPDAQFRYQRVVEAPVVAEGFARIEERAYTPDVSRNSAARAVVLEYDGVLVSNSPALRPRDVAVTGEMLAALARFHSDGWLLFAHAWRPQVMRGELTAEEVESCFDRTRELLGIDVALAFCPHDAGPPICWCRKPLPGLILSFAIPRCVALDLSIYVGRSPADRTLAQRLRMTYQEVGEFA